MGSVYADQSRHLVTSNTLSHQIHLQYVDKLANFFLSLVQLPDSLLDAAP